MDCNEIISNTFNLEDEARAIRYFIGNGDNTGILTSLDVIEHLVKMIREELGRP